MNIKFKSLADIKNIFKKLNPKVLDEWKQKGFISIKDIKQELDKALNINPMYEYTEIGFIWEED